MVGLDLSGVFAFGLDGAITAVRSKLDIVGVLALGMITALGSVITRAVHQLAGTAQCVNRARQSGGRGRHETAGHARVSRLHLCRSPAAFTPRAGPLRPISLLCCGC